MNEFNENADITINEIRLKDARNTITLCNYVFDHCDEMLEFDDKFCEAREMLISLLTERVEVFENLENRRFDETLELKNGDWVAKTDAGWLPGVYVDRDAAEMALDINYETLDYLWCSKFDEFDEFNATPITTDDLLNVQPEPSVLDTCFDYLPGSGPLTVRDEYEK